MFIILFAHYFFEHKNCIRTESQLAYLPINGMLVPIWHDAEKEWRIIKHPDVVKHLQFDAAQYLVERI